jgi:hypothetical protein
MLHYQMQPLISLLIKPVYYEIIQFQSHNRPKRVSSVFTLRIIPHILPEKREIKQKTITVVVVMISFL